MKKKKLSHYAQALARHAEGHWVGSVFFLIFLVDSFVMVIPADSLLSATVALNPRPVKKWYLFSVLGSVVGFALLIFLSHTIFREHLLRSIQGTGYYSRVGQY